MPADTGYKEARAISEAAREKDWELPSFGKGLYLGSFQPELISPQPDLSVEAVEKGERFLAALGVFLQEEVDPQAIERDGKISDEVVEGFKAIGALGMKVPEQYGGLGLSQVYYNRAMMLAGTWHSSVSTLLSAHQSIGLAQPLLLFGSEEQKREWLPKVVDDQRDGGRCSCRAGEGAAQRGSQGRDHRLHRAERDRRRDRRASHQVHGAARD
jgi:alkylation response protein AidB-like acyl-CoA dehydrogenase